jgi:hypothetical protein
LRLARRACHGGRAGAGAGERGGGGGGRRALLRLAARSACVRRKEAGARATCAGRGIAGGGIGMAARAAGAGRGIARWQNRASVDAYTKDIRSSRDLTSKPTLNRCETADLRCDSHP